MNATVCHDFHAAVRQQQAYQDAIVVLGIPNTLLGKDLDGPVPRRKPLEQARPAQHPLDDKAELPDMAGLG